MDGISLDRYSSDGVIESQVLSSLPHEAHARTRPS